MPFKNCPNCGKLNSVKLTVCPKCNCKINDAPASPPMAYGTPYYMMQGQAVPPAQTPMGGMIPPSQPVAAPIAPPPVQPSPFGAPQPSPFGARPANPYAAPQQPMPQPQTQPQVQQPSPQPVQPRYGTSNPYAQPAPSFCPSCGAATIPGAKFCGSCGKCLSQQPAAPAADPAQPTQSAQPQKKNPYIR